MAELAAGAVSSLLVVINNEILLLRGVHDDVQFIKEEMESMNSFLAHLARTEPPGGHNEQVRTWMSQVRLLAQDCNNCINLYLYRGNPDIHRARAGLRHYLWWARWFLHKLAAQRSAAVQLSQLKERARDVGERRLRYSVEIPAKSADGRSAAVALAAGGHAAAVDDEEDHDYYQLEVAAAIGKTRRRVAFFEPPTLEHYVKMKLLKWLKKLPPNADQTWSLAVVAPSADKDVLALARETLVVPATRKRAGYHCGITVDIQALHLYFLPLGPKEILYYILWELQHAKSRFQKHDKNQVQEEEAEGAAVEEEAAGAAVVEEEGQEKKKDDDEEEDVVEEEDEDEDDDEGEEEEDYYYYSLQDHINKFRIYLQKKKAFTKIRRRIKTKDIDGKFDKIKSDIQDRQNKGNQKQLHGDLDIEQNKNADQLGLGVHFQLLHKQPAWDDEFIMSVAKKLKEYMEADEEVKNIVVTEEARERGGREGEIQGEKDIIVRESNKEKDDNEENGKEKGGREAKNGGEEDGGRGESIEHDQKEKEVQNEKKGERGEGRKKNKQEQEELDEEEWYEENEDIKEYFQFLSSFIKEGDDGDEEGEEEIEECPVHLHELQYAHILREVFDKTINDKPLQVQQQDRLVHKQATKTTTMLSEDRVKEIIHEAKQEILKELQEGKPSKNKTLNEPDGVPSQNQKVDVKQIEQKIDEMKLMFKEQLKIKGLVDKIKYHLKGDCPLIILKVDKMMDGSIWKDTRKALSLLECSADALIFTTIKDIQRAKGFCQPPLEPIEYSLVGLYHYTVLKLTNKQKNEENYNPQLFRDILEECKQHEFCMKIFTHALHANPKRSIEELITLHKSLRDSPKSFDIIAKKMFKYSYNDLPKEYKSCLLYLAIFPQEQSIRRSTLVGRWVAEGLIFKEDWHGSVLEANRCFDALINRWLVYPADIGAIGKVKSCMVGSLVHGFITTIARKQHIVEARLSHRFARHFSIFNDLRLRNTDKIDTFLKMLSESSQSSLLKLRVLDLEGCRCFDGTESNELYLKEICRKMLLLKYLSLRGTGIHHLPDEINNLRELEVLDIRETKVPANATVNVLLLKLKRLLAGNSDLNSSNSVSTSSVRIPHKIRKMENMEVLSNIEAKSKRDFKEIRDLCHLRKLGVVFEDKDNHMEHFLETIKDLHECLYSLSITLSKDRHEGIPSSAAISLARCGCSCSCRPMDLSLCTGPAAEAAPSAAEHTGPERELKQPPPKHLESLSITGTTERGHLLLPLFAEGGNNNTLTKVTLRNTPLTGHDMEILAKLPKLRCVRLRDIKYAAEGNLTLTFKTGGFKCLKYLLVEASNLTGIEFQNKSANELEMMVLSSNGIGSISGVATLRKLEELELNNHHSSSNLLSSFEDAKQIAKLTLHGTLLEQGDLQMLAKKPNLQCLVLLDTSCVATQNEITFNKDEFLKLNHLDVHRSTITHIIFAKGSAQKLQKIIWSSSTRLSGICNLPRLKELESHGGCISDEVKKDIGKHLKKPKHKHIEPENLNQAIGSEDDGNDGPTRFPFCWKKQD